jgi:hypothetical protein
VFVVIITQRRYDIDHKLADVVQRRPFCICDNWSDANEIRGEFTIRDTNRKRPDLTYEIEETPSIKAWLAKHEEDR